MMLPLRSSNYHVPKSSMFISMSIDIFISDMTELKPGYKLKPGYR